MKKLNLFVLYLLFWSLLTGHISASSFSGSFFENALSPRVAALGHAFTSISDDSSAIYVNPAGLSYKINSEFNFSSYFAYETQFYGFEFTRTLFGVPFGIAYMGALMDDILETQYEPSSDRYILSGKDFQYLASALSISSAFTPFEKFHLGFTYKQYKETLHQYTAKSYSIDTGILYEWDDQFMLGLSVKNMIRPDYKWNTATKTKTRLPFIISAGFSKTVIPNFLVFSAEERYVQNEIGTLHLGMELLSNSFLPIRFGYDNELLSAGVGLHIGMLKIGYSLTIPQDKKSDHLEPISRFSIGVQLSTPPTNEEIRPLVSPKLLLEKQMSDSEAEMNQDTPRPKRHAKPDKSDDEDEYRKWLELELKRSGG